jgi:hypothetical protein
MRMKILSEEKQIISSHDNSKDVFQHLDMNCLTFARKKSIMGRDVELDLNFSFRDV